VIDTYRTVVCSSSRAIFTAFQFMTTFASSKLKRRQTKTIKTKNVRITSIDDVRKRRVESERWQQTTMQAMRRPTSNRSNRSPRDWSAADESCPTTRSAAHRRRRRRYAFYAIYVTSDARDCRWSPTSCSTIGLRRHASSTITYDCWLLLLANDCVYDVCTLERLSRDRRRGEMTSSSSLSLWLSSLSPDLLASCALTRAATSSAARLLAASRVASAIDCIPNAYRNPQLVGCDNQQQ
jgi:hypothetical protein